MSNSNKHTDPDTSNGHMDGIPEFNVLFQRAGALRELLISLNTTHAFDDELHANSVGAISWALTPSLIKTEGKAYLDEMLAEQARNLRFLRSRPKDVNHIHDSYEKRPFTWMIKQLNALNLLSAYKIPVDSEGSSNQIDREAFAEMLREMTDQDAIARPSNATPWMRGALQPPHRT